MPRIGPDDGELLVTGRGRYIADVDLEGCVEVCFIRSPFAHATVDAVDLGTANGVTAAALGLRPIPLEAGGMVSTLWHPLAVDRVRYAGEPVAMVWAADRYEAEDLAAAASVRCTPLPAATPVHDAAPDNVVFSATFDSGGVDDAMARAHLVVERVFRAARQSAAPIEGRGAVADHDPSTGVTTLWTSTQMPHLARRGVAMSLGVDEASVRVLVPHVGGAFGLKIRLHPEEIAVAALARRLGVPVRWIEDRTENLLASMHAHDTAVALRVAVDAGGRLLAVDADVTADVGAHSVWPATALVEPGTAAATLFAPYAFEAIRFRARAVVSNRCPVGPHRGIGMNTGVLATERMMDVVAAELGLDQLELRRRNAVRSMPWRSPAGRNLDSGDYPALLTRLEDASGYADLRRRQAAARAEGRLLGVGISLFNEHSGSGREDYLRRGITSIPAVDAARVVVTAEGRVEIHTSAAEAGQGHAHTYRVLAQRELGVPPQQVDVIEGDTAVCPEGTGTFISRTAVGVVECVVQALRRAGELDLAPGTDVTHRHDPTQIYPSGAHLAVVEVDPATLVPRVIRYVVVEDCGTVLHPEMVDGQIRGGVATGIGDVLLEEHVYDGDGQLLTSTLRDYLLPLAQNVPDLEIHHLESPSPSTVLGSKGVGEAGTIGAFGAVANAVADAVRHLGAELSTLALSPDRILAAFERPPPG